MPARVQESVKLNSVPVLKTKLPAILNAILTITLAPITNIFKFEEEKNLRGLFLESKSLTSFVSFFLNNSCTSIL